MALHPNFPKSPYAILLQWWFCTEQPTETGTDVFQYYFAQREAVETIIYPEKDKYDLIRYDSSGV